MIAIITDSPVIGTEIAHVTGAHEKQDGYLTGNNYMVAWTNGPVVLPAIPEYYGLHKPAPDELPFFPDPFQMTVKQRRISKGITEDKAAVKQLDTIDYVIRSCEQVIYAGTPDPESELTFRRMYTFLGYKIPYKRAWILSLNDEDIQKALSCLKESYELDSICRSADYRSMTDWLIGINAGMAFTHISGLANMPLGRLEIPTLAMICSRYREHRSFQSFSYYKVHITLEKNGFYRTFLFGKELKKKKQAEELYAKAREFESAVISHSERKKTFQEQPLLYDLSALQQDCDAYLDINAEKTQRIAKSLFEKKLITYPETASRYISERAYRLVPSLLNMILRMEAFKRFTGRIDPLCLSRRSVNNKKAAGHPAIVLTGEYPRNLTGEEKRVFELIAGRMLETFAPVSESEELYMETVLEEKVFHSQSKRLIKPGWRMVFERPEDKEKNEIGFGEDFDAFDTGESIHISGQGLVRKKTLPKPIFSETALLKSMEMENRIGRKNERVYIIKSLIDNGYIERLGKYLYPTEKGLYIYETLKGLRISDVKMVAFWERFFAGLEKQKAEPAGIMTKMEEYTRRVTEEILSLDFSHSGIKQ